MSPRPIDGLELPSSHPYADRHAWQCDACDGIFYPPSEEAENLCPYCTNDYNHDDE